MIKEQAEIWRHDNCIFINKHYKEFERKRRRLAGAETHFSLKERDHINQLFKNKITSITVVVVNQELFERDSGALEICRHQLKY